MSNKAKKIVLFGSKKPNKKRNGTSSVTQKAAPAALNTKPTGAVATASKPIGTKKPGKKKMTRRHLRQRRLVIAACVVAMLAGLYCTAVFSNIPFVKKWRDIYIETAMDTYTHKWLATLFIPRPVIDEVMDRKRAYIAEQQELQSSWEPTPSFSPSGEPTDDDETISEEEQAQLDFLARFDEIEPKSFSEYIDQHPELVADGYDKLLINEASVGGEGTSIMTKNGDQLVVVDAENGLLIAVVKGDGYEGKLAMIKNPAQVRLGVATSLGSHGQVVSQIAKDNHALLAINASGFADPEWKGNGGQVVGLLIANGKKYNGRVGNGYLNIGFDYDDRLYIGASTKEVEYRDAVEFIPAIVINGEDVTDGSTGFGIQPRSVIGQAENGTVFLLTIDGRQVGYSLGTTVGVCADILLGYGAVQASNLDGGSSTIMIYRDEIITKPSSATNLGRYVPDAFIVDYAPADGGADD